MQTSCRHRVLFVASLQTSSFFADSLQARLRQAFATFCQAFVSPQRRPSSPQIIVLLEQMRCLQKVCKRTPLKWALRRISGPYHPQPHPLFRPAVSYEGATLTTATWTGPRVTLWCFGAQLFREGGARTPGCTRKPGVRGSGQPTARRAVVRT